MASAALLATFVVVALAAATASAKGFGGWGRSSGGGYYRSSKLGYYSRTNRYYVTGMYWRSGYRYNFAGPEFRKGAPPLSGSELADIMCKREVRLDPDDTNFATQIAFNSTQNCYKEKSETPGSVLNQAIETLMLNRFRFIYSINPYPTVDMVIYPDKDIITGAVNNTLRLHRLRLEDTIGATTTALDLDLSTLVWEPCTLGGCYPRSSSTIGQAEFGRPSSRFMEGGRVSFASVRANYRGDLTIQLRFWLSSDFDEDPSYDHVFMMPSAVKVDVRVYSTNTARYPSNRYKTILDAVLAAPTAGAGSQITLQSTAWGKEATEYNPQTMMRAQMGTTTDILNGFGSYVSWATASSREYLCWEPTDETCAQLIRSTTNPSKLDVVCTGPGDVGQPVYCGGTFLREGQVGYAMQWDIGRLVSEEDANTPAGRKGGQWYLNFGFNDPSVGTQPDGGAAATAFAAAVVLTLALGLLS